MNNQVALYEPVDRGQIHAVLWQGKMADLVGFPEFNDLVEKVRRIDSTGLLILEIDGQETQIEAHKFYIIMGDKTWNINFIEKKEFERSYNLVPVMEMGKKIILDG